MNKYSKMKRYGDEMRFNYCPICGKEKDNPDFSVNIKTGQYYCFSTGKGGNIKELKDFDIKMLNTFKPIKKTVEKNKDFSKIVYELKPLNKEWLNYLQSRGISPTNEGIKKNFRVNKYNSLTMPITDGIKPVGIKYRTFDKKISSEKGSQSNYFLNWQNIKNNDYLIIVEGEIDLLSSFEAGFYNTVSLPFGAMNLKCIDNQMEFITGFNKIIIATDNDEQGEKSKNSIIEKLKNISKKLYNVNLGDFKDFNEVLTGAGVEKLKNIVLEAQKVECKNQDEAPNFYDENGRFQFNVMGRYLIDKYKIINLNNKLYSYNGAIYENIDIEKYILQIQDNLPIKARREVLEYIRLKVETKILNDDWLIAFKNGIYDIKNNKLLSFDPNYIIINQIPWDYNPNAESDFMDKTLNNFVCNDKDIRILLDEAIGYIFLNKNQLGKAFFIKGDKGNGKSTFFNLLGYLVGEQNFSTLSLEDITSKDQSRFRTFELIGKILNIGDDIEESYIPDSKNFRNVVTGDYMVFEQKNKDPFTCKCRAKFFFSVNELPKIKDPTGATARRIIIIPFKNRFDVNNKDYDPYFIDKLLTPQNMEYLIRKGLEGLERVLKNNGFSETLENKKMLEEFNKNNSQVLQYIDFLENEFENPITLEKLIEKFQPLEIYGNGEAFLYNDFVSFKDWAIKDGLKVISRTEFYNQMRTKFNLVKKRVKKNNQLFYRFVKDNE